MSSPDVGLEWKPIVGYESYYLVSENGDVWSIRSNRKLKLKPQKSGYVRVGLSVSGCRQDFAVHRLVALAFIPNPDNKPTVNHINENKADNRVENLEWATSREQNIHGTRIARAMKSTDWSARTAKVNYAEIARKHDYFSMNSAQMKKVVQKNVCGVTIRIFDSIGQAAKSVNVSPGRIWQCCKGQRKTCKGSKWEYA